MINSLSLKLKLTFLSVPPIVAIAVLTTLLILNSASKASNAEMVNALTHVAVLNSELVHELQKERGLTAGFFGSKGADSFKAKLAAQRQLTNSRLAKVMNLSADDKSLLDEAGIDDERAKIMSALGQLNNMRTQVDNMSATLGEALSYYTATNGKLLGVILDISKLTESTELSSQSQAYYSFVQAKERAGIERAVLSNAFAKDTIGLNLYIRFKELVLLQDTYAAEFMNMASGELKSFFNGLKDSSEFKDVDRYRAIINEKNIQGGFNVVATDWFDSATKRINLLKETEDRISHQLLQTTEEYTESGNTWLVLYILFSIVIIVVAIFLAVYIAQSITKRVDKIIGTLQYCENNNALNQRFDESGSDEVSFIARELNLVFSAFKASVEKITESSEMLASSSQQNSIAISETSEALNNQKDQTYLVATAIEQMSQTINEVSGNTVNTATAVEQAEKLANSSTEVISESIHQIEQVASNVSEVHKIVADLNESSTEITNVVDVIKSVAEQTNLLALNAAIEAARAGEQGRGFAVVADEVRTLAQRTQESTQQIENIINQFASRTSQAFNLIGDCQSNAQNSVDTANNITLSIGEIKEAIISIEQMANQIATASEEQVVVANDISHNIAEISTAADQSAHAAIEIATTSDKQSALATELKDLSESFEV